MRGALAPVLLLLTATIAQAQDQAPPPGGGGFVSQILPMMLIMFAIIYFLMIRPEQKKQKKKQQMIEQLKKGDRILTIGGIMGSVSSVKGNAVMIRTADNTSLEVAKTAISTVLNKDGSEKTDEESKKDK
jgi:preprotein translocase subunit YajC